MLSCADLVRMPEMDGIQQLTDCHDRPGRTVQEETRTHAGALLVSRRSGSDLTVIFKPKKLPCGGDRRHPESFYANRFLSRRKRCCCRNCARSMKRWRYSYRRLSTGSSCAARAAGTVPKITPTTDETTIAMRPESPVMGTRYSVRKRTE